MRKEYIILADDRAWLEKRIAELDKEISDLGPEFYDVFNQSSETWHDNAPFDALRDRQSVMAAERGNLKNVLLHNTSPVPRLKKGVANISSTVTMDNGKKFLIAGHWTYRAGQKVEDATIINCETPLAKMLINKKVGTITPYGTIKDIE